MATMVPSCPPLAGSHCQGLYICLFLSIKFTCRLTLSRSVCLSLSFHQILSLLFAHLFLSSPFVSNSIVMLPSLVSLLSFKFPFADTGSCPRLSSGTTLFRHLLGPSLSIQAFTCSAVSTGVLFCYAALPWLL